MARHPTLSLLLISAFLGVTLSDYPAGPECREVTEEVCSLVCLEERCSTRQEEKCKEVPNTECRTQLEERCDTKEVEMCEEVPARECKVGQEPHCTTEHHSVPREKVERQCKVVWTEQCNDLPHMEQEYHQTPVTTQECNTVMESECTTSTEEVCTEEPGQGVPTSCPALGAQHDCSPADSDSNCWSPGQRDVDCPRSGVHEFGLCCFNGCANVCLEAAAPRRVCKNLPKHTCKQVPRTVCHDVTVMKQESVMNTVLKPVCVPVPSESCEQVVVEAEEQEAVETCVQREVERCEVTYNTVCNSHPEETCVQEEVEQCEETFNEVCSSHPVTQCSEVQVPATVTGAATSCPAPWVSGCSPATSTATCWSPGQQDVDCPGHGFCCYNGCANVCLEEEQHCEAGRQAEECEVVTREHCSAPDHHLDHDLDGGTAHHH